MEDSGDVTVCLIKDRRTAQDFSVTVAASNAPECKYCITSRVVTVAASNAPECKYCITSRVVSLVLCKKTCLSLLSG